METSSLKGDGRMRKDSSLAKPGIDLSLRAHFIDHSPLFQGLARNELIAVAAAAAPVFFKQRVPILQEGEPAGSLHFVFSGLAKQSNHSEQAAESLVRLLGPGDLCGWPSVLTDQAEPATALCLEPTITLAWSRSVLHGLFQRFTVLSRNAVRILALRLREQDERYHELVVERVPQRLAGTLLRLVGSAQRRPDDGIPVNLPLSRAELAQMTGTTMFTVSRLLCVWEGHGLLQAPRGRVIVTNIPALTAIAQEAARPRLTESALR